MVGRPPPSSVSVLLAGDRPPLDRSFKRALAQDDAVRVVAHAHTPNETLELIAACRPEVVMVDVSSVEMGGVVLTRDILAAAPATCVLALVDAGAGVDVRPAADAGAVGYLMDDLPAEFVPLVVRLAGGRS